MARQSPPARTREDEPIPKPTRRHLRWSPHLRRSIAGNATAKTPKATRKHPSLRRRPRANPSHPRRPALAPGQRLYEERHAVVVEAARPPTLATHRLHQIPAVKSENRCVSCVHYRYRGVPHPNVALFATLGWEAVNPTSPRLRYERTPSSVQTRSGGILRDSPRRPSRPLR